MVFCTNGAPAHFCYHHPPTGVIDQELKVAADHLANVVDPVPVRVLVRVSSAALVVAVAHAVAAVAMAAACDGGGDDVVVDAVDLGSPPVPAVLVLVAGATAAAADILDHFDIPALFQRHILAHVYISVHYYLLAHIRAHIASSSIRPKAQQCT